jgi:hypothetical protein
MNIIPEHIDVIVPPWQEFKNFNAVGIGLLHSQPLRNSATTIIGPNFFLGTMDSERFS